MRWPIWLLLVGMLQLGCSIQGYLISSLGNSQSVIQEMENERLLSQGLPPFIIILDTLAYDDPEDVPLLRKAAELHTFYGLSFVENQDPDSASLHYEAAKKYMTQVVELEYELQIKQIVGRPETELAQKLQAFTPEEAPDLFWLGMSWGLWINLRRDQPAAIGEFPYVRVIMERVLELDPNYQNGLPHLFFGIYYGGSSKALGGEPERGKLHFDKIIALTKGEFLLAKVMCAKTYCRSIQNRSLYQQLLNEVIETPRPQNKSFILSNAMAKKQAKELLEKIDEYFMPEEKPQTPESKPSEEEDIW